MTTTKTLTMRATFAGVLFLTLPSAFAAAQSETDSKAAWPHLNQPTPPAPELRQTAPTPRPWSWDPSRFGVALEIRTTWLQDSVAKRLTGSNVSSGEGISLQWDALRLERIATVSLDLGWLTTSTSTNQDFSGLAEGLTSNMFSLGLSVRHYLLPWLAPFARVAGGMGWDRLTVGTGTGDLHDERVFGQGSLGGGLFLRSPRLLLGATRAAPEVGLMAYVEGGYLLGTSSDFTLTSQPATAASSPIPTSPVAIGKVGRDAPYLRVSVGIAF